MIYRDWDHYWSEGKHGHTSSYRYCAKETWDDFEETILASQDDYKKAYINLMNEETKFNSRFLDAATEYIKLYKKDDAPHFYRWWSDKERDTDGQTD